MFALLPSSAEQKCNVCTAGCMHTPCAGWQRHLWQCHHRSDPVSASMHSKAVTSMLQTAIAGCNPSLSIIPTVLASAAIVEALPGSQGANLKARSASLPG